MIESTSGESLDVVAQLLLRSTAPRFLLMTVLVLLRFAWIALRFDLRRTAE